MRIVRVVMTSVLALSISACGSSAKLSLTNGMGPQPILPPPQQSLIPTVQIAPAVGWSNGAKPQVAPGLAVHLYAKGLQHPRWLHVLPNGDVLVAESNAPTSTNTTFSLRRWIASKVMARAGAGVASADRITLLRDVNHDGVVDLQTVFVTGLHSPFGMALVGEDLYIANTDAVMRYRYATGQTLLTGQGTKVMDLPAGPINYHWTKNIVASPDGSQLYVTVGSNSNVGENGLQHEVGRAAIWELDTRTATHRIFASGLRNPNGMAWEPHTQSLWVVVNERDEIGSDLVPDYLTLVKDGGFYGWPYSYYGQHVDQRVQPQDPALVATAISPSYALGPHTASLGLVYADVATYPPAFRNGMFIAQHGSWNRKPMSGYQVIFVPFKQSAPAGLPINVLTGFLNDKGEAQGRPVGLAMDAQGGLLVADDVGNRIWRVTPTLPLKNQH